MNNYLSIGFVYSIAENKTAFGVLEIFDRSIEVIAINEFAGGINNKKISSLLKGIYKIHGDCPILIQSEVYKLNTNCLSSKSINQQSSLNYKKVYTYYEKLSCNEKRAFKLATDTLK